MLFLENNIFFVYWFLNNVSHKIGAFSLVFWAKNETFFFQKSVVAMATAA